jgi:hypothetical protein
MSTPSEHQANQHYLAVEADTKGTHEDHGILTYPTDLKQHAGL